MLGVMLARLARMMGGVLRMAVCGMGVVRRLLMGIRLMMLGGLAMVFGGVLVMVGGGIVMLHHLVFGHGRSPSEWAAPL